MSDEKKIEDTSYCNNFLQSYITTSLGQKYLLSPQMLNDRLKGLNMDGQPFSTEHIREMIMSPHRFEQQLRKLSLHFYNSIPIYKQLVKLYSSVLDFDWEVVPYKKDGKPIDATEFSSNRYKSDYSILSKFFNSFDVKKEFQKVWFNMLLFDAYYTMKREYDGHIYLQEMPSSHSVIDADSYLGYLYAFDLSYFTNRGVDINSYHPILRKKYNEVINLKDNPYNPNLPQRNGSWVYWYPIHPDNGWVFKLNNHFAGVVPPSLDMFTDYSKIDKFKDLEEQVKELESYKVIFATVPRLNNNRSNNKVDDFAISSAELGKFVAAVKQTLNGVDFKAAPLENFKAFDFTPNASDNNLLATEISNMMKESGIADAVMIGGNSVSALNLYKTVIAEFAKQAYTQFASFCEYHINKNTRKFKFKIKFVGTIFDREERFNNANADMERGIITPSIFSSRHIQPTDFQNAVGFMQTLGMPDMLTPIKTASTMSSDEKTNNGRSKLDESQLSDAGEYTRDSGSNIGKET